MTAGINHGYIQAYCGHCFQSGNCQFDDSCANERAENTSSCSDPSTRDIRFRIGAKPVWRQELSVEAADPGVGSALEAAYSLTLCPCKQFFALSPTENDALCMTCIASIAVGRAGECMVCKEPGTSTKTSCCKQYMHVFCSAKDRDERPDQGCPHCKTKPYVVK